MIEVASLYILCLRKIPAEEVSQRWDMVCGDEVEISLIKHGDKDGVTKSRVNNTCIASAASCCVASCPVLSTARMIHPRVLCICTRPTGFDVECLPAVIG
jgi:hypothetical protein